MSAMPAVLGIDAAWTPAQPSGLALLVQGPGVRWRCAALAPSYDSFAALARGTPVDWEERPAGSRPDAGALHGAAAALAGAVVAVVAADLPLSTQPITARRRADSAISRAFGARGASTHSPSAVRPGALADRLRQELAHHGYPLATGATRPGSIPALIEVYPHVSLLALTGRDFRLPYKVQRSSRYHPGATIRERIHRIISEFTSIVARLGEQIGGIELELPAADDVPSLAALKRYEDAIDGLVCAWSALRYQEGEADPYGDETAAIWVPRSSEDSRAGA